MRRARPAMAVLALAFGACTALGVSVGPVFSHYEFVQPMSDRLTDDAWRGLLSGGAVTPTAMRPIANGFERPCPACQGDSTSRSAK